MEGTIDRLLGLYEGGKVSRRDLVKALGAVALGIPLRSSAHEAQPPIPVVSLNHVTCFASDIPRTVAFYQGLFGMPVLSDQGTGINLRAGSDTTFVGIYGAGTSPPRIDHLCLGVQGFDVDRIMGILQERGIQANVRMRDGAVPEIYMSDPDGLRIQLQDPSYCGGSGPLGNVCA
jgi:catechol 2,3-dioxygenase-like lactoylglutathione lyase family enzyme